MLLCCAAGDAVVQAELNRRGLESIDLLNQTQGKGDVDIIAELDADALVLLEEEGPAIWKQHWAKATEAWLRRKSKVQLLVVLVQEEKHNATKAATMLREFSAQSNSSLNVSIAVTFTHHSRRYVFAIGVAGSAEATRLYQEFVSTVKKLPLPGRPVHIPGITKS